MSRDDDYDRPRRVDDDGHDRPPRSNGLATAALVLGLLSLCLGVCAGIPAVVCGILGLTRASRAGTGKGLAIAGLTLGGIMTIAQLVFLPYAVQKVRQAAARSKDSNNLKQTVLSLHNYNDAHLGRLPGPFAPGPDGQPNRGLSWRVSVLPYLPQDAVYRQFKLDEAWDSPANQPASRMVVREYQSAEDPPDNQTRFRGFVGPGTAFENETLGLPKSFPDGTSNTLLVVETADRVPWGAPQDIPYQPGGPLPPLGHPNRDVMLIAMADGSVKTVKKTLSPAVLHALISRNGNEQLPPNWDQ